MVFAVWFDDMQWCLGGTSAIADWPDRRLESGISLRAPSVVSIERSATIAYSLSAASAVTLVLYDIAGRRVQEVEQGWRSAGEHSLSWRAASEGGALPAPGVYVLALRAGDRVESTRVVLLH